MKRQRDRHLPRLSGSSTGREFYIRQIRDIEAAPAVESMPPQVMQKSAALCGLALAQAHDQARDAAMTGGVPSQRKATETISRSGGEA